MSSPDEPSESAGDGISSPSAPTILHRSDPNKEKIPPFDYDNLEISLQEMFPCQYLPPELDPLWVDLPLNDIPLCWLGIPFSLPKVIEYAKEYGFDCPATTPHLARVRGAVDPGKSWHNIWKYFHQQTGVNMRIREVWDQDLPILVFWSNRELVNVKDVMFRQVGMLLTDLGYEDYRLLWYLDRLEEP